MNFDEIINHLVNLILSKLEERLPAVQVRPQPWLLEKDVMEILHMDSQKTIKKHRAQMKAKPIGNKYQYDPEQVELFRRNYVWSAEEEETVNSKPVTQKSKGSRRKMQRP